jgi:phosphotransferase system enzyme I (PtsI)
VENTKKEIVFHGIPASPGVAIGPALIIGSHCNAYKEPEKRQIDPDEIEIEVARFQKALDKTRHEIQELQKRIQNKLDEREASIFDAHLLIVDDKMLTDEIEDLIRRRRQPADYAFYNVIRRYISALTAMQDTYIKERVADIEDVSSRIISNLQGMKRPALDHLPGQRTIVARDLTPSDTALLDRENTLGFAIETGSRTSHTAILARSMQIPAVVGLKNSIAGRLENGDLLIVDGFMGMVIINPKEETQNLYALKESREEKYYADLLKETRLRPETIDGYCIQLAANIEQASDISQAKRHGAAGVGLFRTEYLYINERSLPSEEKQYEIYSASLKEMQGSQVVIRTMDLGGDKLADLISSHYEPNPFLGLRAVRLCLQEKRDLFRTQLRAILRASVHGNASIMFPMVTCVDELDMILDFLQETKEQLKKEKIPFDENIETGIMIETPSAAIMADALATKVDFFSIGTNDLVQYTMAVDRSNDSVAYLYQPSHPAILRLIDRVAKAAKYNNIWVSVCGEMASDPRYTPLLVGLGVHELSMSPVSLGTIRRIIRRLRMHEAEELATKAMACTTAEQALELSESLLYKIAPDIVSFAIKGL